MRGGVYFLAMMLMDLALLRINGLKASATGNRQYLTAFVRKKPDQVIVIVIYTPLIRLHISCNNSEDMFGSSGLQSWRSIQ